MSTGQKKDARFVADQMLEQMDEVDPEKKLFDACVLDEAFVCVKAQQIMQVLRKTLSVFCGC